MESNEIIQQARARFDHTAARRLLREKYEAKLLFAHCGGMWRAGPELIVLLQTCLEEHSTVILDLYHTPVRINPRELLQLAQQHWQEQMNAWLIEHDELSRQR